ncbi:glycerol-3-phosphate dehydrogenase/oxidase [Desulfonatronum sp. SC1]|uniref:glycerol-3-phosphate dehydrogenase/oxidase n=1 Tax=Desulfonatronum sp. SC1 TaxID=2109626 RepID=UPI0013049295|nr:glycerol-3-phosphate dehydrogenase/oxidase [Desulfonatronum sp. SC1]
MKRDLERLNHEQFDVVVVGGGVYGLCTAWDAALRGLRVAVVEQDDFGAKTSAASLKLIHGGLRYLQHLDISRMRVSIQERRWMLRMAPHLVHPLEFIMPCFGHGIKGPEAMRAALLANDIISWDRNRDLPPRQQVPRGRVISRKECLERIPGLPAEGLTGGAVFYDAQMYNSERLTLSFALSAAQEGAALANYLEVTGFERKSGRIIAAKVKDRFTGDDLRVAGRFFINMTGPWTDITSKLLETPAPSRDVVRSKGIQLATTPLGPASAFAVEGRQTDESSVLRRGGRNYFITPWRGLSLIGTTDTIYRGNPGEFRITRQDVLEFLKEINTAYPPAKLSLHDVRYWFGGLRPVGEERSAPGTVAASHRYQIRDHQSDGVTNLISVVGVKYTICRHIAEKVVDQIAPRLNISSRPGRTRQTPLWGGGFEQLESLHALADDLALPPDAVRNMARNHGTSMRTILEIIRKQPELARLLPGSREIATAEIVHAVQHEMALTLSDVVLRRTDLGSRGHPGASALEECSMLVARERGWNETRRQNELAVVEDFFSLTDSPSVGSTEGLSNTG